MYTTREALAYNGKLPVQQNQTGVTPQLLDLLAMQKVDADKKAAAQAINLAAGQANMPTVAQGIEQQALNSARGEIAQKLGLAGLAQQQAPQGPAPQMPPQQGLEGAPSPLPQSYQEGGIVAFSGTTDGSDVKNPSLYERYAEPSVNMAEAAAAIGVPVWLYKQIADVARGTGTTVREILAHPPAQLARSLGPLARNVGAAALTPATGAVLAGGVPATRFANDVMANNPKLRESYDDMGAMGGAMDPEGALAAAIYNQRNANVADQGTKTSTASPAAANTATMPTDATRRGDIRFPPAGSLTPVSTPFYQRERAAGLADAAKANLAAVNPPATVAADPNSFVEMERKRLTGLAALSPEDAYAKGKDEYQTEIGANLAKDRENQKARIAKQEALYARQVSERPSSIVRGLQLMGKNANSIGLGGAFQGVSEGIDKTNAGYTTQDIANQTAIDELNAAMEKARQADDTGRYASMKAARDAIYARQAEGGKETAQMAGNEMQAASSKYTADSHAQTSRAVAALQEQASDRRFTIQEQNAAQQRLVDTVRSIDADLKSLETEKKSYVGLVPTPENKAAVANLDTAITNARALKQQIMGTAYAKQGVTVPAAPTTMPSDRAKLFQVLR
jgi:hypothetical protein